MAAPSPPGQGTALNLLLHVRTTLEGESLRWWLDFEALLLAWREGTTCARSLDIGVQGRGQISLEETRSLLLRAFANDKIAAVSDDHGGSLLKIKWADEGRKIADPAPVINLLIWSERFDLAELECKHHSTAKCNFPSAYLHPMQSVQVEGHTLPCPNGANIFLRGRFGKTWDDTSVDRSVEKNGGSRAWNTQKDTVITFGTYDMFHVGHLNVLQRAAFLGPVYAGVSSDRLNYSKKQKLPMCSDRARMRIVSAIHGVSGAFLEDSLEDKPDYVKAVGATLFVMGSDWDGKKLPWGQTMDEQLAGLCDCMYFPRTMGVSTTELRKKAAAQEKLDQAQASTPEQPTGGAQLPERVEGLVLHKSAAGACAGPTSSPVSLPPCSPSKDESSSSGGSDDETTTALSSAMEAVSVSAGDTKNWSGTAFYGLKKSASLPPNFSLTDLVGLNSASESTSESTSGRRSASPVEGSG